MGKAAACKSTLADIICGLR